MSLPCQLFSFCDFPIEYDWAYRLQRKIQAERSLDEAPDTLILLEHEPVITIGRRSRDHSDLMAAPEQLADLGIALRETDRGGEITYHAPGQLTGYPILDLKMRGRDIHKYLRALEEAIIATLGSLGVEGSRKPGLTGVWVGESKICAIGVKVSRWVTMHGFSLNISNNLSPFRQLFIPCGIRDKGVTSLAELGLQATRSEVEAALLESFADVFDFDIFAAEAPNPALFDL
jgi:lipoyl(octanoyl) transferase